MTVEVRDARFLSAAMALSDMPPPAYAEIAFAGRSNVGKSSLINCLVARKKLVRTSRTPGCTRGINLFRVELKGTDIATLDLVDLPGYGYAKRSKQERRSWGPLIERFLRERAGLRAVVVIIDVRRGFEEDDLDFVAFLRQLGVTPIVVATKIDKLPVSKRKPALARLAKEAGERVHGLSAIDGTGRDELWSRLLRAASIAPG
jgi:GTP-binding protein